MKPSTYLVTILANFATGAALAQYLAPLDASFATPQLAVGGCDDGVMSILGDGSILQSFLPTSKFHVGDPAPGGIARVRSDGNLDTTWGSGGRIEWPASLNQSWYRMLPLSGGRLLVVGRGFAVRLRSDGSLDASYGSQGVSDSYDALTIPSSTVPANATTTREFFSAALQGDESLVIAADFVQWSFDRSVSEQTYFFIRLTPEGRIDRSFRREFAAGGDASTRSPYAWSISADGTVQLGRYYGEAVLQLEVLSLVPGSPAALVPGLLMPRAGAASWRSANVKTDPQGNLFILGDCRGGACSGGGFSITKYDARGEIDTTFAENGRWFQAGFIGPGRVLNQARAFFPWADGSLTVTFDHGSTFGFFSCSGLCAVRLPAVGMSTNNPTMLQMRGDHLLPDGKWVGLETGVNGCFLQRSVGGLPATEATLVEYHHAALDHYFMAVDGPETRGLDMAPQTGWLRTGRSFGAWRAEAALTGSVPVCRFYLDAQSGSSGHFYSPLGPECESLRAIDARMPAGQRAWRFVNWEFRAAVPRGDGQCAPNLQPVYRAYNNADQRGIDPNHRYSTDPEVLSAMQSRGWVKEGIAFCVTLPSS